MKLRPGGMLIKSMLAIAFASLLVFLIPGMAPVAPVAWLACAALVFFDYWKVRQQFVGLLVSRALPIVAGRGRPITVTWRITRESTSSMRGEWRDCLPRECEPPFILEPFELADSQFSFETTRSVTIPVRGEFHWGSIWIRLQGPLGFLEMQKPFDCPGQVRILPETFHSPDELLKDRRAQIVLLDKKSRSRMHGVGTDFESLAEFREGDDIRRIDWRTTARVAHLVVRRYQIERHRDVMLVIDCGRLMGADAGQGSKLDCAIDSALMVARIALQGGDRCGIALFDDQLLGYLPPVSGASAIHVMAECVYAAGTRWRESDFATMFAHLQSRQQKRALVIVISDIVDSETTARFRSSLAKLAQRHVVLFAALQTPVLAELAAAPLAEDIDAARKAVVLRLLREREQALHSLRRGGIHVLDVVPANLTVPLINQFVELRQGNLL